MNLFDIVLLALAIISVITGALRGFVREAAALAGWVLAVVLVLHASPALASRLPFAADYPVARSVIAAALIVLACLLVAHLVGRLLRAAVTAVQMGGPDRILGALFGAVRATAIWLVIAVVAVHVGLSELPFWKSSRLAPLLEAGLRWVSPGLVPGSHWAQAASGA